MYGTGFEPTTPDTPAGQTLSTDAPLANTARLWVDTTEVTLAFAGLVSPGLYRFNFVVPNLPDGDYSFTAPVGGVRTGKIARLRIAK